MDKFGSILSSCLSTNSTHHLIRSQQFIVRMKLTKQILGEEEEEENKYL